MLRSTLLLILFSWSKADNLGRYGFDGTWSTWELCEEHEPEEIASLFPDLVPFANTRWLRRRVCQIYGDLKLNSNDTICSTKINGNGSQPIVVDEDGQYLQYEPCEVDYEPWPFHCFDHCSKSCNVGTCEIRRRCQLQDDLYRIVNDEECSHLGPTTKMSDCNMLPCDTVCPWQETHVSASGEFDCQCGCSAECPNNQSASVCSYCARWHYVDWSEEISFEIQLVTELYPLKWIGIGFSRGTKMSDGVRAIIGYIFENSSAMHNQMKEVLFEGYDGPTKIVDNAKRGHIMYEDGMLTLKFVIREIELNLPKSARTSILYPYSGGLVDSVVRRDPLDSRYFQFGIRKHINIPIVSENEVFRPCSLVLDSVNGNWAPWNSWSPCSATCGTGAQSRNRRCENPIPTESGLKCNGSEFETTSCHIQDCKECLMDLNNMYWYPPFCLDHDSLSDSACDYVASWQWRVDSNIAEFSVKSRDPSKWTGIGYSRGDPMSGENGGLHLIIGFKSLYDRDKKRIGKFWIPNGYQSLSRLTDQDSYMYPQMVEMPSEDLKWENDGYLLENVVEDGLQWLQMQFQEEITQFGNEPWNINLTAPLNFLFPVEGGDKGRDSRNKFDVSIDPTQAQVLENVNMTECTVDSQDVSQISCYHCENQSCMEEDPDFPGHVEKCPGDVHTCVKFYGYIGPFLQYFRSCGWSSITANDTQECKEGAVQTLDPRPTRGELCTCPSPLCNRAMIQARAWITTVFWICMCIFLI
ncbi:uncharacterized protein LOC131877019 isoform X1 [Tigriopus californicus]|uniref:uncharacterized protein LOC131877019 isoform X1 n=2 Tax=Tigriopus californicus TaxID=6832 RepID=UPI0027DA8F62|nr:uncharacterized protein LOC131877019 isoform X1 [Tigriopus californicus]